MISASTDVLVILHEHRAIQYGTRRADPDFETSVRE
jgi:hypothetical protein